MSSAVGTADPHHPPPTTQQPIGEIVETSVTEFTAQACRFGVAPPFGGFVKVHLPERTIYGLVYAIASGSVDAGARPVVRGRDGVRDADIYRENPDLEQVLRTEFAALTIGFAETRGEDRGTRGERALGSAALTRVGIEGPHDNVTLSQRERELTRPSSLDLRLSIYLPPQPPPLHWSVQECSADEARRLTDRLEYFRTVLAAAQAPIDALLAANIRLVRTAREDEPEFALRAGRELATLLKHDYPRLSAILRALQ